MGSVPIDDAEAKAKGLLQIIGSKEVDDDYIAQVKTLSVQPELMKTAGKALKIVYTPLHGSGNKPVRRILKEIGIENVYVVKSRSCPIRISPPSRCPTRRTRRRSRWP